MKHFRSKTERFLPWLLVFLAVMVAAWSVSDAQEASGHPLPVYFSEGMLVAHTLRSLVGWVAALVLLNVAWIVKRSGELRILEADNAYLAKKFSEHPLYNPEIADSLYGNSQISGQPDKWLMLCELASGIVLELLLFTDFDAAPDIIGIWTAFVAILAVLAVRLWRIDDSIILALEKQDAIFVYQTHLVSKESELSDKDWEEMRRTRKPPENWKR